jgi:hypothetical protein
LLDEQALRPFAEALRLVEAHLGDKLLRLQSRFRSAALFVHVHLRRLHDVGHPLVAFINDGCRYLADGGEARGVNTNTIAGANFRMAVERVVMGDGVFLVEADDGPVPLHMHVVVQVAAVANVFVLGPGTLDAVGFPGSE